MARLYTRIQAHFNTGWETGVIAKPIWYDKTLYDFHPANSMGILTNQPAPMSNIVSDNQEYGRDWTFDLYLYATTDANLELMMEQTQERINDYTASNQRWHLNSWEFESWMGLKMVIAHCNETSVITETAF